MTRTTEEAEALAIEWWSTNIARVEREIAAYNAKKPFSKAKNNKEQQFRIAQVNVWRRLAANAALPVDQRDPATVHDINSKMRRLLEAQAA